MVVGVVSFYPDTRPNARCLDGHYVVVTQLGSYRNFIADPTRPQYNLNECVQVQDLKDASGTYLKSACMMVNIGSDGFYGITYDEASQCKSLGMALIKVPPTVATAFVDMVMGSSYDFLPYLVDSMLVACSAMYPIYQGTRMFEVSCLQPLPAYVCEYSIL